MANSVKAAVDAPGLRLRFEGSREAWERAVLPLLGPVAQGAWRADVPIPVEPAGPAAPDSAQAPPPAPGPAAAVPAAVAGATAPSPDATRAPAPSRAPPAAAPPPPPPPAAAAAASWDPAPVYARLLKEEGRKADRDAVLLALVSLAAAGRRDATPAEVLSHMQKNGYPSAGVKARPVLAKLCHRKGMAVPGLLPNTFRATPAGSAYIWRRAKGG